jgi:flagellar basal-body rod modification protein FlgD
VTIEIGAFGASPAVLPANPGGKLGKDEFLKMLVAQLRNQDPLNPMKGDDMAAQLAQFSSLEQLSNIGSLIEQQLAFQEGVIASVNDSTAMNLLGRTVVAAGDQVQVHEEGGASVRFEVGGQGGLATLKILDLSGREVGSRPLGFVTAGRHEFELDSAADGLAAGAYRFAIQVLDSAGASVETHPLITAKVDGVRYGPGGPVLTAGPLRIPFNTILQVGND